MDYREASSEIIRMDILHASSATTTHILHLNEDCLRTVFEHLELVDLCVVVDVCSSFRYVAKTIFNGPNHRKLQLHRVYREEETSAKRLQRIAKCFRNFGAFIDSIDGSQVKEPRPMTTFFSRIIELIALYCSETLTELTTFDNRHFGWPWAGVLDSMSKLKRLKVLRLKDFILIFTSQLIRLCENLPELTELYLNQTGKIGRRGLLDLLRAAPNLRLLEYDRSFYTVRKKFEYTIDMYFTSGYYFKLLLELVQQRGVPLTVVLISPKWSNGLRQMYERNRNRMEIKFVGHRNLLTLIHRE